MPMKKNLISYRSGAMRKWPIIGMARWSGFLFFFFLFWLAKLVMTMKVSIEWSSVLASSVNENGRGHSQWRGEKRTKRAEREWDKRSGGRMDSPPSIRPSLKRNLEGKKKKKESAASSRPTGSNAFIGEHCRRRGRLSSQRRADKSTDLIYSSRVKAAAAAPTAAAAI